MIDEEGTVKDIHYGDRIFYDSVAGVPGIIYPVGTAGMRSNTIADVITMCAARNLSVIDVHGALVLGAAMAHYDFIGHRHEDITELFDLNGQNVESSIISKCIVTGVQGATGLLTLNDCLVYLLTNFQGIANYCDLYGSAMSLRDNSYADLHHCNSVHGVLIITVQAPIRASFKEMSGNCTFTAQDGGILYIRGFKGSLVIDAMTGGTCNIYANGADITINADCTGGTINIWGDAIVTGVGGGVTINNYTIQSTTGVPVEGTYSLPNDVAENTAFTITPIATRQVSTIMLDLSNLVQNADIRVRYDMHGDGAPFPIMETFNWTVGMDDIVYFRAISGQRAVSVTVQSTIAQGAAKDIDYEYVIG